jgi:hypothetical protein
MLFHGHHEKNYVCLFLQKSYARFFRNLVRVIFPHKTLEYLIKSVQRTINLFVVHFLHEGNTVVIEETQTKKNRSRFVWENNTDQISEKPV